MITQNRRVLAATSLESMSSVDSFASAPLLVDAAGGNGGGSGRSNASIESLSALGSMSTLPSFSNFRTPAASTHTLSGGDEGARAEVIEISVLDHRNHQIDDEDDEEGDEGDENESAGGNWALGKPLVHVNMRDTIRNTQPPRPPIVTLTPPTPDVAVVGAAQQTTPVGISSAVSGAIGGPSDRSAPAADTRKQKAAAGPRAIETLAEQSVRVGLSGAGLSTSAPQPPQPVPLGVGAHSSSRESGRELPARAPLSASDSREGVRYSYLQRRRASAPPPSAPQSERASGSGSLSPRTSATGVELQLRPPAPPIAPRALGAAAPVAVSKNRGEQQLQRLASAWERRAMAGGEESAPGEVQVAIVRPGDVLVPSAGAVRAVPLFRQPLLAVQEEDSERESTHSHDSAEVQLEAKIHATRTSCRQPSSSATSVSISGPKEHSVHQFTASTTAPTATAAANEKEVGNDGRGAGGASAKAASTGGPENSRESKMSSAFEYLQASARATRAQEALFRRAALVNDVSAALALVGLALAIAVQECIITDAFGGGGEGANSQAEGKGVGVRELNAGPLVAMRSLVTASTALLVGLNLYYQTLVLKCKLVRAFVPPAS